MSGNDLLLGIKAGMAHILWQEKLYNSYKMHAINELFSKQVCIEMQLTLPSRLNR